jgi:hypothetical protein
MTRVSTMTMVRVSAIFVVAALVSPALAQTALDRQLHAVYTAAAQVRTAAPG